MSKAGIASIVLGLIVGVGAYFVGGKDIPTALSIAFDKQAATVYCGELLNQKVEAPNE